MKEKTLSIPYLVLDEGEGSEPSLLVSAPDGTVLEFKIDEHIAINIDDVLSNSGLWSAFFNSLIQSMQTNEENNPDGI